MKTNNIFPESNISETLDSLINFGVQNFLGTDYVSTRPSANFTEHDDAYRIELAVPGISKDQISINMNNGVMTIKTENNTETTEEKREVKRREFNFSSFSRSFTLPENVDMDNISATQKDGILSIHLSKKSLLEDKSIKKIEIS